MEELILTDENKFPTEDVIFSHIGRAKTYWLLIFDYIAEAHPEVTKDWRYYKDGKSWLMKIILKKKTICWISVFKHKFKMTFYFVDKAEQFIMDSKISDELKQQFKEAKYYNKIRPLTIDFKKNKDVEYAKIIFEVKIKQK